MADMRIEIKGGQSTHNYTAKEMSRKGFYRIDTLNWSAVFSKNTCKVDWGENRERWSQFDPECIVARFREQMN